MEHDFYRGPLEQQGLSVLVPSEEDREFVHKATYEELCFGEVRNDSRGHYLKVIEQLVADGAWERDRGLHENCNASEARVHRHSFIRHHCHSRSGGGGGGAAVGGLD